MYDAIADPDCYPGPTVLKNIPGIRDQVALDEFEMVMTAQRSDEPLPRGRLRDGDNPVIAENEAFFLRDTKTRNAFEKAYAETQSLYYRDQPTFSEISGVIGANAERL